MLESIGNIFSGVSLRQIIVSESGYTYVVWNFSSFMSSSSKKSFMNLVFSL